MRKAAKKSKKFLKKIAQVKDEYTQMVKESHVHKPKIVQEVHMAESIRKNEKTEAPKDGIVLKKEGTSTEITLKPLNVDLEGFGAIVKPKKMIKRQNEPT